MMNLRVAALILLTLASLCVSYMQWPVFFEPLGRVHSIHNKWDLAIRVAINLPGLEERIDNILEKLNVLASDLKDPEEERRRRLNPNHRTRLTRLDELNTSWKEQNKKLKARCDNMKRRARDLKELGQDTFYQEVKEAEKNNNSYSKKSRRSKRQAGFLKGLFGVAYTQDVDTIRDQLNGLDSRVTNTVSQVKAKTNHLKSKTEQMLGIHTKEIKHMEDMAHQLQRKVIIMETNPFMRTSISDLVHVRNEAYKRLSLEADLVEERLLEIETTITSLGSGKISKSVISPRKLRTTLAAISSQLPDNMSLLFGDGGEDLWPYYSVLPASASFEAHLADVVVTVSVPLVDAASALDLSRVHNLPVKVKDGYSVVVDVDTEYLVTDPSKEYYLELRKEDFQDCQVFLHQGSQQFFCGLSPLLRADAARSCVMQLLRGVLDPAWCQTRLAHGPVQPFSRLYNGSWVYSALASEPVHAFIECPGKDAVATELKGFGVFGLDEGCTMTSPDFKYSHTHAGRVEVSVGFGDDDIWDGEDDSKNLEDYDISNFQDDIMLQGESSSVVSYLTPPAEGEPLPLVPNDAVSHVPQDLVAKEEKDGEDKKGTSTLEHKDKENSIETSGGDLEVTDPVNKEVETAVYKNLLVKLKNTFQRPWILARRK